MFDVDVDPKTTEDVKQMLKRARLTILEFSFLPSLVLSLTVSGTAKDLLDTDICMLAKAQLATTDLHPAIWFFIGLVVKGGNLAST